MSSVMCVTTAADTRHRIRARRTPRRARRARRAPHHRTHQPSTLAFRPSLGVVSAHTLSTRPLARPRLQCGRLTDAALDAVTSGERGKALRKLYLSACARLSNAALSELVAARCTELTVCGCTPRRRAAQGVTP